MRKIPVLMVLVCLGCDSMPTMPMRDPLVAAAGAWVDNFTVSCSAVLTFDSAGGYELARTCVLPDGTFGSSRELGTYSHDDATLTRTPAQSACGAAPSTVPYSLEAQVLSLDGVRWNWEPGGGMAASAPGCIDDAGTFTPL